jgi:hypothetical protein
MADRVPLVLNGGNTEQLQSADTLANSAGVDYQLKDEKNAASGYVGLSSAKRVSLGENAATSGESTLAVDGGLRADGLVLSSWYVITHYTLTADDIAGDQDFTLFCNSASPLTVTLPSYVDSKANNRGRVFFIRNLGTGTVTISVPAGDLSVPIAIEGASSVSLAPGNAVGIQMVFETSVWRWRYIANTSHHFAATDKLLGRSTAGAGWGEEIALTSVARTLIAQTSQANMRSTGLGLGTASTLASSAVAQTANNLSDLASAPTARTNLGLATVASSGSAADLGTGTLPLGRLSGITNTELAAGAAIVLSKLATQAAATILGNNTGGAAVPTALTAAQVKTLLAIAAGDVSGLATVATSGSAADLGAGTLPLARLSGITNTELAAGAAIALSKLATQADATLLGNNSGGAGVPLALTAAQARTLLGLATVATSASAADLSAGTLPLARLSGITDTEIAAANKDGAAGTASMRTLGTGAAAACAGNDSRLHAGLDIDGRVYRSRLSNHGTAFLLVSGVAYFVYLGRTTAAITPKHVEFYVSALATGTNEVGEVGFFSTPSAPNKAAQSLTKLVASGSVDTVKTGLGVKRNTSAFGTSVAAGTHLWAGVRYALNAGTVAQPTMLSLGYDFAEGQILSTAASGVLTGAGPFAGAIITASAAQVCPDLRGVLD